MNTSLEKSLVILQQVAKKPQSLGDLSATLGVHKSTVLRLLNTLEQYDMVNRDVELRYCLGSGLYALAHEALASQDLRDVAAPLLRDLNSQTRLTVHLAVFQSGQVIYIDKYEGWQHVQMYSRIGLPAPHSSGVAKAILAFTSAPAREEALAKLEFSGTTDTSIRSLVEYRAALQQVHERGYAVDHGELEPFIHCIGAPILSMGPVVVGGISITATTSSHSFEQLLGWVPELRKVAASISKTLGGAA